MHACILSEQPWKIPVHYFAQHGQDSCQVLRAAVGCPYPFSSCSSLLHLHVIVQIQQMLSWDATDNSLLLWFILRAGPVLCRKEGKNKILPVCVMRLFHNAYTQDSQMRVVQTCYFQSTQINEASYFLYNGPIWTDLWPNQLWGESCCLAVCTAQEWVLWMRVVVSDCWAIPQVVTLQHLCIAVLWLVPGGKERVRTEKALGSSQKVYWLSLVGPGRGFFQTTGS